jgi:hypothetical protein
MGEESGDKATRVGKNPLGSGLLGDSQWWWDRGDMKRSSRTRARGEVSGSADALSKVTSAVRDGRHPELQSDGGSRRYNQRCYK